MIQIHSNDTGNPYEQLIKTFFFLEFPKVVCRDANNVLEGVTSALVATGQVRYGPAPGPEGLVAVRDVVRCVNSPLSPVDSATTC